MYFVLTDKNNKYVYDNSIIQNGQVKTNINGLILNSGVNNFKKRVRFIVYKFGDVNFDYFMGHNYYIRTINIPNNLILKKYRNIFILDKLIVSDNKYCMYDPNVVMKFNLNITQHYVMSAIYYGCVDFLEWLKNSGLLPSKFLSITYVRGYNMFEIASEYNQVNVLEWCKKSDIPRNYTEYALYCASLNGNLDVLTWWKNSGLPLKYDSQTIDHISSNIMIRKNKFFKTWLPSSIYIDYYDEIVKNLNSFRVSGSGLEYQRTRVESFNNNIRIDVLNWWLNSNLPLKYTENTLDLASFWGYINVLQWWVDSGLQLKYSKYFITNRLRITTNKDLFRWWIHSGILPYKSIMYIKFKKFLHLN